jgi:2-hydroxy-3-keto-5-methylthiopentenyl-1-phosphate phosphatase
MLINQAARQRARLASKCFTVREVYCDFDGTITRIDATDAVLEAFALPVWREWEQRWVRGEITSQECLSQQVALIQVDRETVVRFAADLPIDKGIIVLDRWCAEHGVPLTIVSDGIDLIVEAVLQRHGLLHLPVFSNHLRWDEKGVPSLSFPFAAQECESGAGTCKCSLALSSGPSSSSSIYIGDGQSDRCVSSKISTVFAKGALQDWCELKGINYFPFETLTEVTERLISTEARAA